MSDAEGHRPSPVSASGGKGPAFLSICSRRGRELGVAFLLPLRFGRLVRDRALVDLFSHTVPNGAPTPTCSVSRALTRSRCANAHTLPWAGPPRSPSVGAEAVCWDLAWGLISTIPQSASLPPSPDAMIRPAPVLVFAVALPWQSEWRMAAPRPKRLVPSPSEEARFPP